MENEITFAALRCHFQTGRSYVIAGVGRNRVYGFRIGVQCDLGDIEKSEWIRMVKEHISRQGEEELHQQLLQHLKDQNYLQEEVCFAKSARIVKRNCQVQRAVLAKPSTIGMSPCDGSGLELRNTTGVPPNAPVAVSRSEAIITKIAAVRSVPCAVS